MRRWAWVLFLCCLLLAGGSSVALAAGGGARLTIVDGAAAVHLSGRPVAAVEGLLLVDGTLIDTDAKTRLLRIEWPDGRALDLGPDTRVMLAPPPGGTAFYLLQGWAKYSTPSAGAAQGWLSPPLDVAPSRGVAVVFVDAAQVMLFAESGRPLLIERAGGRRQAMEPGEFYSASGGAAGTVSARPLAALLQRMPAAFRDTLPLRLPAFKARDVTAAPLPSLPFAALQGWLEAEPALRREFARRFSHRLAERDFRAAVAARLRQLPEWEPLLNKPPLTKP